MLKVRLMRQNRPSTLWLPGIPRWQCDRIALEVALERSGLRLATEAELPQTLATPVVTAEAFESGARITGRTIAIVPDTS